jgi:flagellar hook-associated protein 2
MASIGSINFGGLASGLDTDQIIESLVKVDSKPLERLKAQKTSITEKKDIFASMNSSLLELKSTVSDLKSISAFNSFSASSSKEEALTVNVLSSAREGNYSIKIHSLAQAKTLSGNSYSASDTPLGFSGEIMINGKGLRIRSADTLLDISSSINSLKSGVQASILKVSENDSRLVLSASSQGSKGFIISNAGSGDTLGLLGLTDGTKQLRHVSGGNVLSAAFDTADSTIGSLAGLSSRVRGTVTIRNQKLEIDLSTDTLSSIRDKVNALGVTGVFANVETVTEDNKSRFRLSITGTGDFSDDGNVLESLGILAGGTEGVRAKFQTGALLSDNGNTNDSVNLTHLGAVAGETITISGSDAEGAPVSQSITIEKNTKISDLLSRIEEAFSGDVTADFENGRITLESAKGGENLLSVRITANGEYGGSLDFGTVSTTTVGRERLLSEGRDAKLLVNNVTVTRSSNEVKDVLAGITLNLKKADPDEEINITVTRNTDAVKTKIEDFVKAYNDLAGFIDEKSQYNQEDQTAGALNGDSTSRTVLSRIRSILRQTVNSEDSVFTLLVQAGVEFTAQGRLNIVSSKLDEALKTNVDSLTSLFTATRTSSNSDINFVFNSAKTIPGSYTVEITKAAERATVQSEGTTARASGELTVTDNYGSKLSIAYEAGESSADIANRLNVEAGKTYSEILQSNRILTDSEQSPITQTTLLGEISGAAIESGDTITLSVTDHNGKAYQRKLTLASPESNTVRDVLDAIEAMTDSAVSASIDSEGRLRVQDLTSGTSKLTLSISTTVNGLDFGSFSAVQKGRNTVAVEAGTSDERLTVSQRSYGSSSSFSLSGGEELGLTAGEYRGIDAAGTINGQAATGKGQSLTASASDASTQGITVHVTATPEELAAEGVIRSTITLTSGIADSLYRELSSMTDSVGGFVKSKIDSFERSLSSLEKNISQAEERVDQRRQQYVRKFTELEMSLSRLQSIQQRLSSTLSSL